MKKMPLSRGIAILPSLFTTLNMFCGFFSIVRSISGDFERASWAIFVAAVFDSIDGRLARMTKTQSDFGREYDSLVDLASFGLAPAILVYTWSLSQFRSIGWIFAFLFFACVALRLARYNVQIDSIEKKRFQGLPSPPAACMLASFVIFYQSLYGMEPIKSYAALALTPVLALLMVSTVRYRSFKEYDVKRTNSIYILIGAAAFIALVAINPNVVLFLAFLVYSLSGPVGEVLFFQRRRMEKMLQKTPVTSPPKTKTQGRRLLVMGSPRDALEKKSE